MTTPVCELLGIERPIVQAPMSDITGLAAAVSNAGALGMVTLTWSADTGAVVRETAALTARPFDGNFVCCIENGRSERASNKRVIGCRQKWKPIVMLTRQHSHEEITPYYRAADLCLVTSLHDGMNLVAKEFLAARHDEQGVLILSQFTGAARELRDALLINPYDIDQTAEAIRAALEMEPEDKQARMHRMRKDIKERNIYRWAGDLITELCDVRLEAPEGKHRKSRASASVSG